MPACTSPRRRSRARNAPQLVPCTRPVPWPDIPLFSLSSSARPSLRPTWNANSLDRILCLLFCFSRVVVQAANHCFLFHSSLIVFIQVFLQFLNLYRHSLLCFSQVFPPFPCVFYFAHAGIGRFSPSNPFDTYLSAFSPYSSRPLFALGPCQKPAAGWVLRLRCSQAFAAIALVPATACAQKTSTSPLLATDASQPVPGHPSETLSLQEWRPKTQTLFHQPSTFFVPSGSGSSGTVRYSILVLLLLRTCGRRHSSIFGNEPGICTFAPNVSGPRRCRSTFGASSPQPPHHRKSTLTALRLSRRRRRVVLWTLRSLSLFSLRANAGL